MDELAIRPLTADTWDALADLFAGGGDPKWCWCQFWRKPGVNWNSTTPDDNVANALLDAAIAYAREHGAAVLEGYPVETGGERMSSASVYTGTTGMFERAGFALAASTTSKAGAARPRVVVRRTP